HGTIYLPGQDTNTASGDVCFEFAPNTTKMRVVYKIDSNEEHCHPQKKSPENVAPCDRTSSCSLEFSDVPATSTYYNEIMSLKAQGAISGYEDNTFRPSGEVNRGQLAKMAVLAFGLSSTGGGAQHFSDVPASSTYYSY